MIITIEYIYQNLSFNLFLGSLWLLLNSQESSPILLYIGASIYRLGRLHKGYRISVRSLWIAHYFLTQLFKRHIQRTNGSNFHLDGRKKYIQFRFLFLTTRFVRRVKEWYCWCSDRIFDWIHLGMLAGPRESESQVA